MTAIRHIGALVAAIAIFLGVAGCATTATVPATVVIQPDPALTAKDACPAWPKKADVILKGTDSEGSTYDLKAYDAYRCERSTRLKVGDQIKKLVADAKAVK